MRVMPFPRAACLSQGTGAAVCWMAATWGEGGAPPPGTSLPAKSPACKKYCLQRVAWGWRSAGRRNLLLGEWGQAPKPASLQGGWLLCVGLQGSPSPMACHHAQAELPKAGPLGMVGVETAVAGSCPGWSRCGLCPVLLCSHGQGCRHPHTNCSQQFPSS